MQLNIPQLCGFDSVTHRLTALYCQADMPAQALADWFSSVDFEALPPEITCMAASAGALCGFDSVPGTVVPRLRGIIKYVHTLNSGMMAGICMIGKVLNQAGIDVLLLEDTALYAAFPDAPQRHLWQMRLGVRRRDFQNAVEHIAQAGFETEKYVYAAVAKQGITRQVSIMSYEDDAYLWQNTTVLQKGAVRFLCPALAATFIQANQSAFRALTKPSPRTAMVRWCMDMKLLTQQMTPEDWQQMLQIAAKEKACGQIRLLTELFCALSGDTTLRGHCAALQSEAQLRKLPGLLLRYRRLPETGHRLQRAFLRCRLRRPDSLVQSCRLLLKQLRGRRTP